jgi:hypothetical protein
MTLNPSALALVLAACSRLVLLSGRGLPETSMDLASAEKLMTLSGPICVKRRAYSDCVGASTQSKGMGIALQTQPGGGLLIGRDPRVADYVLGPGALIHTSESTGIVQKSVVFRTPTLS